MMIGRKDLMNGPYFRADISNSNQRVTNENWVDVELSRSTTKFTSIVVGNEQSGKDLDLDDGTWSKFTHHTLLQAAHCQSVVV